MRKAARKINSRENNGQALIFGVSVLTILIAGAVLAIFLLVNLGISSFYYERLAYIADQVAVVAGQKFGDSDADQSVRRFANRLLHESGLPDLSSLEISKTTKDGKDSVKVKLSVEGLILFSSGDFLPKTISIHDEATADLLSSGTSAQDDLLSIVRSGNQFAYVVPAKKVDLNKGRVGGDLISGVNLADKLNTNASIMLINAQTDVANGGQETGATDIDFRNDGIKVLPGFKRYKPVTSTL